MLSLVTCQATKYKTNSCNQNELYCIRNVCPTTTIQASSKHKEPLATTLMANGNCVVFIKAMAHVCDLCTMHSVCALGL